MARLNSFYVFEDIFLFFFFLYNQQLRRLQGLRWRDAMRTAQTTVRRAVSATLYISKNDFYCCGHSRVKRYNNGELSVQKNVSEGINYNWTVKILFGATWAAKWRGHMSVRWFCSLLNVNHNIRKWCWECVFFLPQGITTCPIFLTMNMEGIA